MALQGFLERPPSHQRLQSSTRMDTLTNFSRPRGSGRNDTSPRDSLSPDDEHVGKEPSFTSKDAAGLETESKNVQQFSADSIPAKALGLAKASHAHSDSYDPYRYSGANFTKSPVPRLPANPDGSLHGSGTNRAGTREHLQTDGPKHCRSTPSHAHGPKQAWSPRFRLHRPSKLYIDNNNGLTAATTDDVKFSIRSAESTEPTYRLYTYEPLLSPPAKPRRKLPKVSAPSLSTKGGTRVVENMGNSHSHSTIADDSALVDDSHSINSIVRSPRLKAVRLPRRSSINVFKRFDCKSPVPPDFSAAVIEVPRAATAPNLDDLGDDDDEDESDKQERGRARHVHRHSAPSPALLMHSASPATLTEESAARPQSAVDTITNRHDYFDSIGNESSSPSRLRISALSPTLPTPSPLPEDSPHKYGLKDRMDTPEMPSPPLELNVAKAKRRSSGLEIFNARRKPYHCS
jgi:hypothetical protein